MPPKSDFDPLWTELMSHGPLVVFRWSGSPGILTFVSGNFMAVFGLDPTPFLKGQALIEDRINEEDREPFTDVRGVFSGRIRFLDGKNTWRLVDHQTVLLPRGHGRERTVLAYWLDVTEKEDQRNRLELALAAAQTGTWELLSPGGRIRVDPEWPRLTGYPAEELSDLTVVRLRDLIHPFDRDLWDQNRIQIARGGQVAFDLELRLRHRSGPWIWFRVRGKVTESNSEGRPVRTVGTLENIDAFVQSKEERSILSQVVDQGPGAVILTDTSGTIEYVNRQFTALSGYTLDEVQGKNPRILKSSLTPPETYRELWAALTQGKIWTGVFQNLRKDGTPYWVQASLSPITDQTGKVYRYVGQQIDITSRKSIEEAAQAQYQFQVFLTRTSARLVRVDQGKIRPALQEILGELGQLFRADRAKIAFLSDDGESLIMAGGWHRAGSPLPQEVPLRGFPEWKSRVKNRESFLSVGHPIRVPWANHPVASLVAVPLEGGNGEDGCLFLEAWLPRPGWKVETEVSLLVVANTLSSFLKRSVDEEELRLARAEADRANQAKTDFLTQMSHEIRTPMNGVLGLTELVLAKDLNPETRSLVEGIRSSGETLLALVNDILDLSKVEAGKIDLEELAFSLGKTIEATLIPLKVLAAQRGVNLEFSRAPGVPDLRTGDPNRLRQILTNLVGNAVKFSPRAGLVILGVEPGSAADPGTMVKFSVRDQGPGVPPEKRHLLFQKFSQTDASTSRVHGGSGLGLAICRELAERMGGQVGYEDPPDPPGSIFWVTVRLPEGTGNAEGTRGDSGSGGPRNKLRVLVVEDNAVNQKVAEGLLRAQGVVPVLVSDGIEALDQLVNGAFDLVLMDVQMPVLDGLAATRAIRKGQGGGRHLGIPVVAMTANVLREDFDECLAAGMDDCITKPLSTAELTRVLDRWSRVEISNPKEPSRRIFDPAEMKERLQLDDQLVKQILGMFLSELPKKREALVEALENRDFERLARLSHTLKGTASNLVAQGVADAAKDLENAAKEGRTADLGSNLADLLREMGFLEIALLEFPGMGSAP